MNSQQKMAYILLEERLKNVPDKFQDAGLVDSGFFYDDFFQNQFPKDAIEQVVKQAAMEGELSAYIVCYCDTCGGENVIKEENFREKETQQKITQGEYTLPCTHCAYTLLLEDYEWKFAIPQEKLKESDHEVEQKGFLQKMLDFFRVW